MKVHIAGNTPMERLTEFTRRIVAVPKGEVARADKKRPKKRRRKS